MFTSSQAARYLGVSLATIRRWTDAGHLTCYRTPGGQRRFSRDQLDGFIASLHDGRAPSAHQRQPEHRGRSELAAAERASSASSARQAAELLAQPPVEGGARAAGRSCRRRRRSARRSCRPARSRRPGARRPRRRAARASGCGSSARSSGATTSARAVSECGAMKETTKPSTPQAITGPPLARL